MTTFPNITTTFLFTVDDSQDSSYRVVYRVHIWLVWVPSRWGYQVIRRKNIIFYPYPTLFQWKAKVAASVIPFFPHLLLYFFFLYFVLLWLKYLTLCVKQQTNHQSIVMFYWKCQATIPHPTVTVKTRITMEKKLLHFVW